MRLLQYRNPGGDVCVGVVRDPERIEELAEPTSVRELAGVADESGEHLESVVRARLAGRYAARSVRSCSWASCRTPWTSKCASRATVP